VALERAEAGRPSQSVVLYGLRGVGKTVLLIDLAATARRRGWMVATVEAGTDKSLRQMLGEALHPALADLVKPSAGQRLRRAVRTFASFKTTYDLSANAVTFGLDLADASGGDADSGVFETDLAKLVEDMSGLAAQSNRGLVLGIDEAQDLASDELVAICGVAHRVSQQGWPVLVALAGLPSLPRVLSEAKSYAERLFTYTRIEQLHPGAAKAAIVTPAAAVGVDWESAAVHRVVRDTHGYPYFLQQYGQATWTVAESSPIRLHDVEVGSQLAVARLDAGFFRARWDRATNAEKRYLKAMAVDGDRGSGSGEVAERLGKPKVSLLGPTRARLISKRIIYVPDHGVIAFTVPNMADFINRQPQ